MGGEEDIGEGGCFGLEDGRAACGYHNMRAFFLDQACKTADIFGLRSGRGNQIRRIASEIAGCLGYAVGADDNALLTAQAQSVDHVLYCQTTGTQNEQSELCCLSAAAKRSYLSGRLFERHRGLERSAHHRLYSAGKEVKGCMRLRFGV